MGTHVQLELGAQQRAAAVVVRASNEAEDGLSLLTDVVAEHAPQVAGPAAVAMSDAIARWTDSLKVLTADLQGYADALVAVDRDAARTDSDQQKASWPPVLGLPAGWKADVAEDKLIFREASAQALEDAFAKRAAGLREGISGMGEEVHAEIAAWDSGAESRQAQEKKAGQLQKRAESLTKVMDLKCYIFRGQ